MKHNLRDFPVVALARYQIEAQHSDEFIRHLLDLSPVLVVVAVRDQQASLSRPSMPVADLFVLFQQLGLAETTAELRRLMKM